MKRPKRYTKAVRSDIDILAQAHFSEKPERCSVEHLPPAIKAEILEARLRGFRLMNVYWPDGKFALLLLQSGEALPRPEMIIAAYRQCEETRLIFPKGVRSWHS